MTAIIAQLKGQAGAIPVDSSGSGLSSDTVEKFFVYSIAIFLWSASILGRSKSWWLGGGLGTVGGSVAGFIFFPGIWIIFSTLALVDF